MAVDAALLADSSRVAASASGAAGDNQVASALAALRDQRVAAGGSTFAESWGQIVYRVGNDSATARTQHTSRQGVADAVLRLKDSVSGVSLDEEAASLIKYQRAYEANAKFFAAIGETLDVLLRIV
jgi:flagellar hook-associated protein 1 FlgK